MSVAIDIAQVTHVLLADGWHEVAGESFTVAPYEFGQIATASSGERTFVPLHGATNSNLEPMGFEFSEARTGASIAGPLASVIAVRREQS